MSYTPHNFADARYGRQPDRYTKNSHLRIQLISPVKIYKIIAFSFLGLYLNMSFSQGKGEEEEPDAFIPKVTFGSSAKNDSAKTSNVIIQPTPRLTVSPSSSPTNPPPISNQNSQVGTKIVREVLIGYPLGEFSHPSLITFCTNIVSQLDMYIALGYRIKEVKIKGFADAHSNSGVSDWTLVPEANCRWKVSGVIFDDGLAHIRGCLIKEMLVNLLQRSINYIPKNQLDRHNEKVLKGGNYRKVEILIILS